MWVRVQPETEDQQETHMQRFMARTWLTRLWEPAGRVWNCGGACRKGHPGPLGASCRPQGHFFFFGMVSFTLILLDFLDLRVCRFHQIWKTLKFAIIFSDIFSLSCSSVLGVLGPHPCMLHQRILSHSHWYSGCFFLFYVEGCLLLYIDINVIFLLQCLIWCSSSPVCFSLQTCDCPLPAVAFGPWDRLPFLLRHPRVFLSPPERMQAT